MTIVQGLSIKESRRELYEQIKEYATRKDLSFSQAILDLAEEGLTKRDQPTDIQREILGRLSRIEKIVSHPMAKIDIPMPEVEVRPEDDPRQQAAKRAVVKGLLG